MSGSRWLITSLWYVGKTFFVQFCVFFPPLLNLFCFCLVHTISVLNSNHFCMKCSLGISNFLEEISSLSHFIVFLYFFALFTEGFLISLSCLELCIQMVISFLVSFAFHFSSFSDIYKASSDSHFAFLHCFWRGWLMVLVTASYRVSWAFVHSSSGNLSNLIPWFCLPLPLYNHEGFDLDHTWMA